MIMYLKIRFGSLIRKIVSKERYLEMLFVDEFKDKNCSVLNLFNRHQIL